jgi:hypothetical protein
LSDWTGAALASIDQEAQRYIVQEGSGHRPIGLAGRAGAAWVIEEGRVTQAEANSAPASPPRAAATVAHHHHHQHYRHSTASLLGASVLTRLAFVAGLTAALWLAIVWALA